MSASGDPIRKSPREFIIPIAVEGGGYVTPRATSLEPSESMSKRRPFPRRIRWPKFFINYLIGKTQVVPELGFLYEKNTLKFYQVIMSHKNIIVKFKHIYQFTSFLL